MKINSAHELEEATGRVPRIEGRPTFRMDGNDVPFDEGQSILAAALAAGHFIPFLCYHPEFAPHGSCKVCSVRVNGRTHASCTQPAREGDVVESNVDDLKELRQGIVQFLFVEGNHFCPSCEASGNCTLQAVAYDVGMTNAHFNPLFPDRPLDAQSDAFWWGGGGWDDIDEPYGDFRKLVRGYDPRHRGILVTEFTVSLDGGAGFGGPLLAGCVARDGTLDEVLEA